VCQSSAGDKFRLAQTWRHHKGYIGQSHGYLPPRRRINQPHAGLQPTARWKLKCVIYSNRDSVSAVLHFLTSIQCEVNTQQGLQTGSLAMKSAIALRNGTCVFITQNLTKQTSPTIRYDFQYGAPKSNSCANCESNRRWGYSHSNSSSGRR
jgi:hypothetical protein